MIFYGLFIFHIFLLQFVLLFFLKKILDWKSFWQGVFISILICCKLLFYLCAISFCYNLFWFIAMPSKININCIGELDWIVEDINKLINIHL